MRIALFLACFCLIFSSTGFAQNILRVSGHGTVLTAPDGLQFDVIMREKGPLVSKLFASVSQKTEQVQSLLIKQGVEKQHIQSMQIFVSPWIEYENQNREQKGFELTRIIKVNIKETEALSLIFDHVFRIANVEINNIQMLVNNEQQHYETALLNAIADAQDKAKQMAGKLGVSLGEVVGVSEISANLPVHESAGMMRVAAKDSFMPGETGISAIVEVQFAIN
ncbi:SIMPL domain-containing protein [Planctobacterium marinum]|uniref:SIMPL domain-containing protein n=1 Tax=Planctobacterium marinum TaxID=1631968 RepID=UPI001E3DC5C9|nr:SIMPL domain-containing protein [Planctobacterium marinum]MCC2604377.1 SIMPL domain-containing protein [Planctobacterium marinum]